MSPKVHHNPRKFQPKEKAIQEWSGWGWSIFFGQLIIAFGFLIFGLTHFAFADRGAGSGDYATQRQPASVSANIRGEMNWSNGVGTIREAKTGRVYTFTNSEGMKALWDSGVKNVAVQGHVNGNGNLTVENVSTP